MSKLLKICLGELRHKVAVELQDDTQTTPTGGELVTWPLRTTIWCKIKQLSGFEKFSHQQLKSIATHKFTTQYVAGILTTDRLNFNGRLFNIISVDNVEERNEWLVIIAAEGVIQ